MLVQHPLELLDVKNRRGDGEGRAVRGNTEREERVEAWRVMVPEMTNSICGLHQEPQCA